MVRTSFAVVATTCTTLHGSAAIGRDPTITITTSHDIRGSADTITTTASGDLRGTADATITATTSDDLRGSADANIGHSRDRHTERRIDGDASHRHASAIATTTTSHQNVFGASPRLSTTCRGAIPISKRRQRHRAGSRSSGASR